MNSLIIAAMTVIALYVGAMIYAGKQIPESISQTVFLLPRKGQWVFSVVMVMVGFLLMPVLFEKVSESTQFIAFFIGGIIDFLIVAIVVFIVMKKFLGFMQNMRKKEEEAPAAPPAPPEPSAEEKLLTEIRDLLKK